MDYDTSEYIKGCRITPEAIANQEELSNHGSFVLPHDVWLTSPY